MDRYNDTTFLIRQITKQCYMFNIACNQISDLSNMANDAILKQKKGIFSAVYNFLFGLAKSQDVPEFIRNVTNLMQTKQSKIPYRNQLLSK